MKIFGNANIRDQEGNTPLHYAVNQGNNQIVKTLHEYNPSLIDKISFKGMTILSTAINTNRTATAELLHSLGARHFPNYFGLTSSDYAVILHNEYLINLFNKKHSLDVSLAKEKALRSNLWHSITPPTDLCSIFNHNAGPRLIKEIELGGYGIYFFLKIANTIEAFSSNFPEVLSSEKAAMLKNAFINENYLEQHKNDLPIFLKTGFQKHFVVMMIWKEWFCICNRGGGKKNNIDAYKFKRGLLTEKIITEVEELKDKTREEYLNYLYIELPEEA